MIGSVRPIVEMKKIGKNFGSVNVLNDVDFTIYPGEVHVLAGENGAGKSTLIKILSGVHSSFNGEIFFEGKRFIPANPLDANNLGVSVIYQELSLVRSMNVIDNLFLGRYRTKVGFVRKKELIAEARKILSEIGLDISLTEPVENFPISVQQLIEIAKALSINAKVIVMDEPSSALNTNDVKKLFALISEIKARGCGIIYITHKMEEIEHLADRITVLRDGKLVASVLAKDITIPKLINWMVGREITEQVVREKVALRAERLKVEHISVPDPGNFEKMIVKDVSLRVHQGEILGVAGLQGSGASELFMGLFGALGTKAGKEIYIDGKNVVVRRPPDAIKNGLILLTNDRKASGLVQSMSSTDNIVLPNLKMLTRYGWRSRSRERSTALGFGKLLKIRSSAFESEAGELSGGNQQKVVFAKWLLANPLIMLLDEPTRGIDVGAKQEIYMLMNELTKKGISIMLITSEMPELLAMSDRIVVMHRGEISAEFQRDNFSVEKILEAAMGMGAAQ